MAANGILDFQGTNQVNFMGAASNIVIDTVTASLGIGVDVNGPTSNLHVVGNAHVSTNLTIGGNIDFIGNLTQGGAAYGGGGGGSSPWLPTTVNVPADGIYYTAGNVAVDTNTFFVDSVNDRVGVGTTTPGTTLDVLGDGAFLHAGSGTPHNSNDLILRLGGLNNGGNIIQSKCAIIATPDTAYGGQADYGRNAIHFCIDNSQNNTNAGKLNHRLSIKPNGLVGIRNANPVKRLHIKGYSSEILAGLDHITAANDEHVGLGFGLGSGSQSNRIFKGGIFFERKGGITGRGDLLFCVENTADDTTEVSPANAIMRITRNSDVGITGGLSVTGTATFDTDTLKIDSTSNRVGIGLIAPDRLFHVNGISRFVGEVEWFETGQSTSHANYGANRDWYIRSGAADGKVVIQDIHATSNVGIGTSTPGYKLDVTGDIRFTGNIYKGNVLQALNSPFLTNGTKAYYTDGPVGIANVSALTTQTLQIGANVVVDDTASDKLVVSGDVFIARSLHAVDLVKTYEVKCNALFIKDVQVTNQVPEDGDLRGYTPGIS